MIHLHKLQVYCYGKARIVPKVKNLYFYVIERVMTEGSSLILINLLLLVKGKKADNYLWYKKVR